MTNTILVAAIIGGVQRDSAALSPSFRMRYDCCVCVQATPLSAALWATRREHVVYKVKQEILNIKLQRKLDLRVKSAFIHCSEIHL